MTHVEMYRRAEGENRYREWLRRLPIMHKQGGRNPSLVPVARAGIAAGRSDEQLFEEIVAAGGEPRLSDYEVRRAIDTAHRPYDARGARHPAVQTDGGAFFRTMLKAGTFAPLEVKPLGKYGRHYEFFKQMLTIFDACGAKADTMFWTGLAQYSPRDRQSLTYAFRMRSLRQYRSFIIPNPMTGERGLTGDDRESWACKATVASAPLVVCEFDDIPPEQQLMFWSGVIAIKPLDVRSLVWSGSKSYHALVKVPDGEDRDEYVRYLQSVMPGIDPAPMHSCGLTRLAGGVNEKTDKLQRLVWSLPR